MTYIQQEFIGLETDLLLCPGREHSILDISVFLSGLAGRIILSRKKNMQKNIIDDGFRADLVKDAYFAGTLEIPIIERPDEIIIPQLLVPFTRRKSCDKNGSFLCFYEHDRRFKSVLTDTEKYIDEIREFSCVISPDCSLYWDMPLNLQIVNIYMNRAIAFFLQSKGIYVIPNVRWGDERTFTTDVLPEKVAFLGLPKHSIVSVGTYGCVKSEEEQAMFRKGLIAMLDELEPQIVLVYGAMPDYIFHDLKNKTKFIQYPDWTSYKKRGAC